MTKDCPEIKSVWSPECGKELVWDYELLRSMISAGQPGGHRLLDCFVRAAKPHFYPELVDYVLAEQSLYFECIGMHIEKGSNKIILVDTVSEETAQIKKDTFLELIANLGHDYSNTNFALSLKDFTSDGEESLVALLHEMETKVKNYLKAGTSEGQRVSKRGRAGSASSTPSRRPPRTLIYPSNKASAQNDQRSSTRIQKQKKQKMATKRSIVS